MCPLIAAPARGYADFQRLENYDSGVLYSDTGTIPNPTFTVGPFDVSRYAYLGGREQSTGGFIKVTINWWQDAAATVLAGSRSYNLTQSTNTPNPAQIRFPNLGPFVTLTYTKLGGSVATHLASIFATNRVYAYEFTPQTPVLIEAVGGTVGAGGLEQFFPASYYAGPIRIWLDVNGTGLGWTLQLETGVGFGDALEQVNTNTVVGNTAVDTIAPPGAWSISVYSAPAAPQTGFELSVQQSMTGST